MRKISFRFKLMDRSGVFKRYLYPVLATLDYVSLSSLKQSLKLTLSEEEEGIDYLSDRVQCWVIIDGKEHNMGEYLLSNSTLERRGQLATRECYCYSLLWLLQAERIRERTIIEKGSNVITAVRSLLVGKPFHFQDLTAVTNTTKEYPAGTDKLSMINDLLSVINYTSLVVSADGVYTASFYVLPTERAVDITYSDNVHDESKKIYQMILPEMTRSLDLFNVPNVFLAGTNSLEISPPMTAVYINNNPASIVSTVSRGIEVTDELYEVEDAADYDTLYAILKRKAYARSDVYEHIDLKTAINPLHGHMNCVQLEAYGKKEKFIETGWSMDLKVGGEMRHRLRRVISI